MYCLHHWRSNFMLIWEVRPQHPLIGCALRLCSTVRTSGRRETHTLHGVEWATGLSKRCLLSNWGASGMNRAHAWLACIVGWSLHSEKFWVCLRGSVKFSSVVFWCIEELFVSGVTVMIILRIFYVKIGDPAQLTKNIPIFAYFCIIWHSGPLHFVFLIRIQLPPWNQRYVSLLTERFVKVFLVTFLRI